MITPNFKDDIINTQKNPWNNEDKEQLKDNEKFLTNDGTQNYDLFTKDKDKININDNKGIKKEKNEIDKSAPPPIF